MSRLRRCCRKRFLQLSSLLDRTQALPRFEPDNPGVFVDELERQIRQHILSAMPPDPSGELAAEPIGRLLLSYGNWRSRFVRAQPRTANLSSKLQGSAKLVEHKAAIDDIVRAIQQG